MEERQRERQRRTSQRAGQEKTPKERKNGRELESNMRTLGWRGTIWNLKAEPLPGSFPERQGKKKVDMCTLRIPRARQQQTHTYIYIPRSSVRHFYRVRRRTSNSGVFLDLVRDFFQVTLCGFSRLCILCGLHLFEGKPTTDAKKFVCKVCSFACSAVFSFHRFQHGSHWINQIRLGDLLNETG